MYQAWLLPMPHTIAASTCILCLCSWRRLAKHLNKCPARQTAAYMLQPGQSTFASSAIVPRQQGHENQWPTPAHHQAGSVGMLQPELCKKADRVWCCVAQEGGRQATAACCSLWKSPTVRCPMTSESMLTCSLALPSENSSGAASLPSG